MSISTPNKTFTIPSGTTYAFIHRRPSNPQKPTLLFLHGFPCTSYEWRHQIHHFINLGYGVLAPDLLGYGGSSKPTSPSAYLGSIMASDIIAILNHEDINSPVIGIAHDWGTYLLSQLAVYYPERFQKYVFLSVPFRPPGIAMDVHAINAATKKELGYPMCAYWLFLTEEGTGKLLGDHVSLGQFRKVHSFIFIFCKHRYHRHQDMTGNKDLAIAWIVEPGEFATRAHRG